MKAPARAARETNREEAIPTQARLASGLPLRALALLLALLCIAGCAPIGPAGDQTNQINNPGTGGDSSLTSGTPAAVPGGLLFESLAQYVEAGNLDTTQRVLKVTTRAMKSLGVAAPPGFDAAFQDFFQQNRPLDAATRADAVARLRRFSK